MPRRDLDQDEFLAIKARVMEALPADLDQTGFERRFKADMARAVSEAEHSPAPNPDMEKSAARRLLGGAWKTSYPGEGIPLADVPGRISTSWQQGKEALDLVRQGRYTDALRLAGPRALEMMGLRNPVADVGAIGAASVEQGKQAVQAAQEGSPLAAAGHAAATLPILGPAAAAAGERIATGDIAGGVGEGIGLLAPFGATYGIQAARTRSLLPTASKLARAPTEVSVPVAPPLLRNRNPQAVADIAWGEAQGIPIDAATMTGNRFVRGTQRLASESLFGSTAAELERAQIDALRGTGERLATRVSAAPETVETAGRSARGALLQAERDAARTARGHYQEFDRLEASPENLRDVALSKRELSNKYAARNRRMEKDLGAIPTPDELRELRRIREELNANPYQKGKLVQENLDTSATHYAKGSGNANVYDDILDFAPGTSDITGAEMSRSISKALETGAFDNPAMGAMRVARERLAKSQRVSRPTLAPDAGDFGGPDIPTTVKVQSPIDYRSVKRAIAPTYARWKRQAPFARADVQKAYDTMGQIIRGPDFVRAADADIQLGTLKGLVRGGKEVAQEGTLTRAQGLPAMEIGAIEDALAQGLQQVPGAAEALTRARAATSGKFQIRQTRKLLGRKADEPTRAFDALTAKRDVAAETLLSQLQQIAPQELPKLGRALLEELLDPATAGGGFEHAKAVRARWEKVGPRTREMLFGPTQHDIDRYLRLADVITEHPNPSGSGMAVAKAGQLVQVARQPIRAGITAVGLSALARLLNSPAGARALVRGLRVPIQSEVAQAAAVAQLQQLAAGLPREEEEEP